MSGKHAPSHSGPMLILLQSSCRFDAQQLVEKERRLPPSHPTLNIQYGFSTSRDPVSLDQGMSLLLHYASFFEQFGTLIFDPAY